ncbi:MAG: ABC transporter ATP-binding protein [Pirellulaceae bacterium]|nr:ABC transporter ATP-binding protein [Pirellulaceae bacterium]
MKNFLRAARHALRYRLTLASVVATAILVGLLWGINIGAVYPFVEVIFRGQSLHGWVDEEIQSVDTRVDELEAKLFSLEDQSKAQPHDPVITSEIRLQQTRLEAERQAKHRYEQLAPWIRRYAPDDPFQTLVWIVAALGLGTVLKNVAVSINSILVARLSHLTVFGLRNQLYRRTLASDLSTFSKRHNSVVVSHFTNDVNKLNAGLSSIFGKAMLEPFKMFFCLVGACLISWQLVLLSLIITPPALVLMRSLAKSIKRANHRAMEEMSQIYRVISETLNGIHTVKAFTTERWERLRFHKALKRYLRTVMKIVIYNAFARPMTELLGIGVISLSLVAGAYLVIEQQTHLWGIRMSSRPLGLASLLLFYGFLAGASGPARKLSGLLVSLQGGFAAADRVYELMDRETTITNKKTAVTMQEPIHRLELNNVSFAYQESDLVLEQVNLQIKAGETLAIVGSNGSGKSTLINLLLRFYDPTEGSVSMNGIDLRELRVRALRQRISLVTQQPHLFDDTVINNIRYGSPTATDAEVVDASQRAHAHDFIVNDLTNGYESSVGQRGSCLSGGQRQRIALARAILRNPDLLILDEATSQIDIESEQSIHRALESFVQGRTAIMVTHRLSTLRLASRVVVMDAGRINDVGSHEELIRRCEIYQRLHEIHFRRAA